MKNNPFNRNKSGFCHLLIPLIIEKWCRLAVSQLCFNSSLIRIKHPLPITRGPCGATKTKTTDYIPFSFIFFSISAPTEKRKLLKTIVISSRKYSSGNTSLSNYFPFGSFTENDINVEITPHRPRVKGGMDLWNKDNILSVWVLFFPFFLDWW